MGVWSARVWRMSGSARLVVTNRVARGAVYCASADTESQDCADLKTVSSTFSVLMTPKTVSSTCDAFTTPQNRVEHL